MNGVLLYVGIGLLLALIAALEAGQVDDKGIALLIVVKIVLVVLYGVFWPLGLVYTLLYHLVKHEKVKA